MEPTRESLLEARVHYGHLAKKWNPDFKVNVFAKKNGRHLINVNKTLEKLLLAGKAIKELTAQGKKILFVGRKKTIKDIIQQKAQEVEQPYIVERWLGGTFTNFPVMRRKLKELLNVNEKKQDTAVYQGTKKEQLIKNRKLQQLVLQLGGMVNLNRLPGALFVADINFERTAVKEAQKIGIPIFAIWDSNASAQGIEYPIPANDDARSSVSLIVNYLVSKIQEGKKMWQEQKTQPKTNKVASTTEKEDLATTTNKKKKQIKSAKKTAQKHPTSASTDKAEASQAAIAETVKNKVVNKQSTSPKITPANKSTKRPAQKQPIDIATDSPKVNQQAAATTSKASTQVNNTTAQKEKTD